MVDSLSLSGDDVSHIDQVNLWFGGRAGREQVPNNMHDSNEGVGIKVMESQPRIIA